MVELKRQNIVIVGGGMVGVSLALLLSKSLLAEKSSKQCGQPEYTITLIEQFPLPKRSEKPVFQPSFDDRSTAISAGSAAILKQLDCWPLLATHSEPIEAVHVSDRGHFGGTYLDANDYSLDAVGYVIENRWLGQVLLQQLQQTSVQCLAPAKVTACSPQKKGYQLTIETTLKDKDKNLHSDDRNNNDKHSDEIQIDADLLLIADGADSELRTLLGIDTRITDYHQAALIANVVLSKPHNNIAYERFTDEGPIALLPLSDLVDGASDGKQLDDEQPGKKHHKKTIHRASLVWTLPNKNKGGLNEVKSVLSGLSNPELLAQLQKRFGYRAGKILSIGEKFTYPLKLIEAAEQVRSHLVVIGNAAHFLHPVAGQGFNLALRDCQTLVECLNFAAEQQQPLGIYSTLKRYLDKQSSDQQLTIGVTDRLVKTFSSNQLPQAVLRQLGLISLGVVPQAKNTFAQKMMGMRL